MAPYPHLKFTSTKSVEVCWLVFKGELHPFLRELSYEEVDALNDDNYAAYGLALYAFYEKYWPGLTPKIPVRMHPEERAADNQRLQENLNGFMEKAHPVNPHVERSVWLNQYQQKRNERWRQLDPNNPMWIVLTKHEYLVEQAEAKKSRDLLRIFVLLDKLLYY